LGDSKFRRRAHATEQAVRRGFFETRRIDQPDGAAAEEGLAFLAVAGDARCICDKSLTAADKAVEQR
jgi:hypothetical protein